MRMLRIFAASFILFSLTASLVTVAAEYPKEPTEETDPKAFKVLKEKSIDPQTGIPKTLDASLFEGTTKQAYQIAKEIPKVLAQMP